MSDVPPAPVRPDRWLRGTPRAEGLAGTGRRYMLTVAVLSSLAAAPTLVAVALGAASLHTGSPGRSPFVIQVGPLVVVVPDPDWTPPERRRTAREVGMPGVPPVLLLDNDEVGAATLQPAAVSPVRLGWPESESARPPTGREHRPAKVAAGKQIGGKQVGGKQTGGKQVGGKQVVRRRAQAQVPGRSIAGWSRPAGPRR